MIARIKILGMFAELDTDLECVINGGSVTLDRKEMHVSAPYRHDIVRKAAELEQLIIDASKHTK